jgi:hypothetical protein
MRIPLSPVMLTAAACTLCRLKANGATSSALLRELVLGPDHPANTRWDAAFVSHVGYWSHFDNRSGCSGWPLPLVIAANDLGEFALSKNVLSDETPQFGELFLQWSPSRGRFVRTGIVIGVEPRTERMDVSDQYECHTIEANITPTGRLDGDRMGRVVRLLAPKLGDRTIRWTDLEVAETGTRDKTTERMQLERDIELGKVA